MARRQRRCDPKTRRTRNLASSSYPKPNSRPSSSPRTGSDCQFVNATLRPCAIRLCLTAVQYRLSSGRGRLHNVGKLHRLRHTAGSAKERLCGSLSNSIHNAPGAARCKLWLYIIAPEHPLQAFDRRHTDTAGNPNNYLAIALYFSYYTVHGPIIAPEPLVAIPSQAGRKPLFTE